MCYIYKGLSSIFTTICSFTYLPCLNNGVLPGLGLMDPKTHQAREAVHCQIWVLRYQIPTAWPSTFRSETPGRCVLPESLFSLSWPPKANELLSSWQSPSSLSCLSCCYSTFSNAICAGNIEESGTVLKYTQHARYAFILPKEQGSGKSKT